MAIQVRHTPSAAGEPTGASRRQDGAAGDMAEHGGDTGSPPLPGANPVEEIRPRVHGPGEVRSPVGEAGRRDRLHRDRSPAPRHQGRPPPPPPLLQGLRRLHRPLQLDANRFRQPLPQVRVFLIHQHHHHRCCRQGEVGAGDSRLRRLPHGPTSGHADAEAAKVCGHDTAVSGAIR